MSEGLDELCACQVLTVRLVEHLDEEGAQLLSHDPVHVHLRGGDALGSAQMAQ